MPKKEEERSIYEEPKMDMNGVTFERLASIAEPQEIGNEDDDIQVDKKEQEVLLLCENFENDACQACFKTVEENEEQSTKLSRPGKMENLFLKETGSFDEMVALKKSSCKVSLQNADLHSSDSFRASVHSLSTCHDSISSSTRCPSRNDLFLDLECRICHDHQGPDLISPCHCAGTSKWVHESCIIKWIRHTKVKQCEICTGAIIVKRKKKPIDQVNRSYRAVTLWHVGKTFCIILAIMGAYIANLCKQRLESKWIVFMS